MPDVQPDRFTEDYAESVRVAAAASFIRNSAIYINKQVQFIQTLTPNKDFLSQLLIQLLLD